MSLNIAQRESIEALIDKEIVELNALPDHDPRICELITEKVRWWQSTKLALSPSYSGSYSQRD